MQTSPDDVMRALAAAGVPPPLRFTQRDTTTISARFGERTLTAVYYEKQSARRYIRVQGAATRRDFDFTWEGLDGALRELVAKR